MKKNFFPTKIALISLVAACFVVNASMGVRQTFGLFSNDFQIDCGISNTEFGLAVALHSLVWGIFTPIFGRFADQYGLWQPNIFLMKIEAKLQDLLPLSAVLACSCFLLYQIF